MSTATVTAALAHGETSCVDVEALLSESNMENDVLRDRLAMYEQADADRQNEMDALRTEVMRTRALLGDMRKKMGSVADERGALDEQVQILFQELEIAERDTVPTGSVTFAAITQDEIVATYRRVSRINRGPVPPSILAAISAASEDLTGAMQEAGSAALEQIVRREVRRRRRAQAPSRRVATTRSRSRRG